MKKNKNLLVVIVALTACLIAVWFSSSIQGVEKSYEVRPVISLPEYKTDTARAIDAYERMMNRFMSLTESNLIGINTDVKDIDKKLDSIDNKLTKLSARMARIEKALGIELPEKSAPKLSKAQTSEGSDKPSLQSPQ